jgi:hypothetical protein
VPAATTTVAWESEHAGACGKVLNADLRTFDLQLAPD